MLSKLKLRGNVSKFENFIPPITDKLKYTSAAEEEIWKNVEGKINNVDFDQISKNGKVYQISNWGRLRYKKENQDYFYCIGSIVTGNYKRTNIRVGKIRAKYNLIHKLVADYFLEKTIGIIIHLDDNKANNLKYGNNKDNAKDRKLNNKYNFPNGENHCNSKLNKIEVLEIKNRLKNNESIISISKKYLVNRETIRQIKLGNIWKEVEL